MKKRFRILLLTGIFTFTSMNMLPAAIAAAPDYTTTVSVKYGAKKEKKKDSSKTETETETSDLEETDLQTEEKVVTEPETVMVISETEAPIVIPESETPVVVPETEMPIVVPETEAPVVVPETEAPIVTPETESPVVVPETEAPVVIPETESPIVVPESEVPSTEALSTEASSTEDSMTEESESEAVSETEEITEEGSEILTDTETESETADETETETETDTETETETETEKESEKEEKKQPQNDTKTPDPVNVAANYMQITGEPIYILGQYPTANIGENTNRIYDYLVKKLKLNHAAACGVLANIQCESNFSTTAVGDGGTSYGLCQWHLERFADLIRFCAANGYDFHMLDGQLEFMAYELNGRFEDVYKYLQEIPDTADGSYQAAYYWCRNFEAPSHIEYNSQMRADLAKSAYYPKKLGMKKTKKKEKKPIVAKKSNKSQIIVKKAPTQLQTVGLHKSVDLVFVEEMMQVLEEATRPKL